MLLTALLVSLVVGAAVLGLHACMLRSTPPPDQNQLSAVQAFLLYKVIRQRRSKTDNSCAPAAVNTAVSNSTVAFWVMPLIEGSRDCISYPDGFAVVSSAALHLPFFKPTALLQH